jgi:hypothetical protein
MNKVRRIKKLLAAVALVLLLGVSAFTLVIGGGSGEITAELDICWGGTPWFGRTTTLPQLSVSEVTATQITYRILNSTNMSVVYNAPGAIMNRLYVRQGSEWVQMTAPCGTSIDFFLGGRIVPPRTMSDEFSNNFEWYAGFGDDEQAPLEAGEYRFVLMLGLERGNFREQLELEHRFIVENK